MRTSTSLVALVAVATNEFCAVACAGDDGPERPERQPVGTIGSGGPSGGWGQASGGSGGTVGDAGPLDGGADAGASATGGAAGTAGAGGSPPEGGTEGGAPGEPCDDPNLVWQTANKTHYESYPAPGSEECEDYNGCSWAGQFAYCEGTKPESWVEAHNIASVFPPNGLQRHHLCLRKGPKTIVVTAIDTCSDSDCDGCCTENLGNAARLIDIEKYTDQRWGVPDGPIEWVDLGENLAACE